VARAIEEVDAERLDERAALIAHHWEEAGEGLEAARWHGRAAERTGVRDITAAFRQWRRLCAVLEGVPKSRERSELRLAGLLQILNLGLRLGLSADDAATAFAEAHALATELDDRWSLALAFNTYSVLLTFEGRLTESLEHCEEASRLADGTDDVGLQLLVATDRAHTLFQLGRLEPAMEVFESALAETPEDVTVGRAMRGFSPYIMLVFLRAAASAVLGRLPDARSGLERALELAREQGEVEIPGFVHLWLADCSCFAGDLEGGLRHSRSAIANAEQTANRTAAVVGYRGLGSAQLARSAWNEAVDALETSLRITREEGVARMEEPQTLAWLADAYHGRGEIERALATASEAIALARRLGTRWKEIPAHLARSRALRAHRGSDVRESVTAALRTAEDLVKETGARVYLPFVWEERAALAAGLGDKAARERDLREAQRLFAEMGATGHAERLARELGS
jgi:tetratricopeptide (TPR) repeat protein